MLIQKSYVENVLSMKEKLRMVKKMEMELVNTTMGIYIKVIGKIM